MKAAVLFGFLISIGALYASSNASAQKPRSAPPSKFSKFTHKSHAGQVKSLIAKNQTIALDCAYCHGAAARDKLGKDQHDIETIGYPSHKDGLKNAKTHSTCFECHAITGSAAKLEMCLICHEKTTPDSKQMATNIRRFPNPAGGVSQFYDTFSHGSHVDYYEQYATSTPLKDRVKFFDAKATDPKANKGLDKNRFECAACHTINAAPVTIAKITFAKGVKMGAPSHPECFICHFDAKVVSPPKADKPNPKNTFATNCTGCHAETAKPPKADRPVAGSELAVHWFARQIINTELNPPAVAKAGVKSPLPFSHKTHEDAIGKGVGDCLSCHATAKTAATLKDFYLEDRKTKEKQPVALSCVDCHKKEMQAKIEGAVTLETAKCNYCHSLTTIKAFGVKGIPLPPPSHFGKKAIQPTPTSTAISGPTSTATPATTPKPTPTPVPTKTPPPPKAQTLALTPTKTPTQNPPAATAPTPIVTTAPTPVPPTPTPAPTQALTQSAATPPAAGAASKIGPPGIVRLGDPKESPHWGQHNKWGVVENFNHGNHIKPAYSQRCQDCHHTNKDARVEAVLKCISCHKETGHADTTGKGGGVNVEDAYHGISGSANKNNKAGCIECHKTYRDEKNPDSNAPIKLCSACHTEKQAWLDQRKLKPLRSERVGESEITMRQWIYDFRSIARR